MHGIQTAGGGECLGQLHRKELFEPNSEEVNVGQATGFGRGGTGGRRTAPAPRNGDGCSPLSPPGPGTQ